MENLTPTDLIPLLYIVLIVILVVVVSLFWSQITLTLRRIGQFFAAIWRRYVTISFDDLMSRIAVDDLEKKDVAPRDNASTETRTKLIATTDNANKAALHIVEDTKIEALALLIKESEKKAFSTGRVPETRGLQVLFGVSSSSKEGSEYQRLRAKLKQQLEYLETPKKRDEIVAVQGREVVREKRDGTQYKIVKGKQVEV